MMESELVNYPCVRRDVIGLHGEVKFSLLDIRDGEVVATWIEIDEEAVWDEDCYSGDENENTSGPEEEDVRRIDPFSVYVGNLDPGTTKEDLVRHFSAVGEILRVSLLKGRNKGVKILSAFICFSEQEAAECALLLEGSCLRGVEMIVKEKLLTMSDAGDSNEDSDVDPLSIYIGNLDHRVTSLDLASHFHSVGEVDKVTVLRNNDTGEHRGAAYVQFKDLRGLKRALSLDGCFIAGKNVRIKRKRKTVGVEDTNPKRIKRKRKTTTSEDTNNNKRARRNFSDGEEALSAPHKSSQVYVGNLDLDTSKHDLEEHFNSTGDIVRVIVMKKGKVAWAFIQFNDQWSVEGALFLNGTVLRDRKIKVQRKRSIKANK
jgi:RNA recognition motif-containing protein